MGKTVNESSYTRDPYLLPGTNTSEDIVAKMLNVPGKNHEAVDFTPPPPPKAKKSVVDQVVEDALDQYEHQKKLDVSKSSHLNPWHVDSQAKAGDKFAVPAKKNVEVFTDQTMEQYDREEKLGATESPFVNPWMADSQGKAGQGVDIVVPLKNIPQVNREVAETIPEVIAEEAPSISDDLSNEINALRQKKKSGAIVTPFEERYISTQVSLKKASTEDKKEEVTAAAAPQKEEEVSWTRRIWNKAVDLWNNLIGNPTKTEEVKTDSTETETVDGVETKKPAQPLNQRPELQEPAQVKRAHFKKLITEMNDLLNRMNDALREVDESLLTKEADVLLMNLIKKSSLKQNQFAREEIKERTSIHNDLKELNKAYIEKINKVKEDLVDKQNISDKLGWVNMGLTALGLIGTIGLIFATGGTAAFGILAAGAGFFNGVGMIAKGIVDDDARKFKGEIDFITTNRQLVSHRMETNVSDMQQVISAMHQDIERIIMMLAMIKETIRHGQMMS